MNYFINYFYKISEENKNLRFFDNIKNKNEKIYNI